jgi:ATP-dependent Clp protease ATP-binding subunit ClpX
MAINPSAHFRPEKREKQILPFIEALANHTPKEISNRIRGYGYVGQDVAVKATALLAYRHVARLKKIYLSCVSRERLPKKANVLFVGPTGCGKTYLVEILFRDILNIPTVIVDMSTYSETGYVGQDVNSILTRLIYAADLNPLTASIGVVCLDEFDKLSSGQNNAVFAGAGTTKDVSGLGVQRELLKMLESAEVAVPMELSHSDYAPKTVVSTQDIPFVACGAFSGLKGLIERKGEHIGFGREGLSGNQDQIAVSYTADEVEITRNFLNYGFLPELIGRFNRFVPFHALEAKQLLSILNSSVLNRYRSEFRLEGIDLIVEKPVLQLIVEESLKKEAGARGIESALSRHLEDAAFEAYSNETIERIRLVKKDGEVRFLLE